MHKLEELNINNNNEYQEWLETQENVSKAIHHVLALQVYGPDIKENLAPMRTIDHINLHKEQNIPYKYMWRLVRKQRKRENWHIILTEDDISGRWEMQGLFLEWNSNLPGAIQDLNKTKLLELWEYENNKLISYGWEPLEIEDNLDLLEIHSKYIEIQKEISRRLHSIISGI